MKHDMKKLILKLFLFMAGAVATGIGLSLDTEKKEENEPEAHEAPDEDFDAPEEDPLDQESVETAEAEGIELGDISELD